MSQSPLESDVFQTDWPQRPAGPPPPRHSRLAFMRELPVLILLAFGLALGIKTYLIQAFYIPSASMEPTLHGCTGCNGDRVLVNKLAYRFREPRRGEIVVFVTGPEELRRRQRSLVGRVGDVVTEGLGIRQPADVDFIKRIVALPGETIRIEEGRVKITTADGRTFTLSEPYLSPNRDLSPFGPFKVAAGSYFVMGDNRANSSDSRVNSFGFCFEPDGRTPKTPCAVPRERLVGKAFVRIWPVGRMHVFDDPGVVPALLLAGLGAGARRAASRLPRPAGASGYPQPSWSRTAPWRQSSARRGTGSSPGSTRSAAARSPGRW